MKKILFATTALVMTAGAASADIALKGFGRFGIVYDESLADDTYLEQRFQLDITGTTETDGGLTVGGKYRLRSQETAATDSTTAGTVNAAQMFVSAGGLTVEVGNIDYALDNMPGAALGTIGLQNFISMDVPGYASRTAAPTDDTAGGTDTGVALLYTMGGLSAHVSYNVATEETDGYIAYEVAGYTFALGGADFNEGSYAVDWVASVSGSITPTVSFNAYYADGDDYGLFGAAAHIKLASALTAGGFVLYDDEIEETGFGADLKYGLGGGATLVGGVFNMDDVTEADMGITFNF